jgi:RNA polymerase sigma factor (sigma-70 family)
VHNQQSTLLSDIDLVRKIIGGDRYASALLIRNTEKLVAQIVFNMARNPADRKDLMQDIYLKAFKNLPNFRFRCKLSTWIAQIGYNTCIDYLEKQKAVLLDFSSGEDSNMNQTWEKLSADGIGAEQLLVNKEKAEILNKIVSELPPVYHTLITMFHKEELSIEEISEITGLPDGTIKNYLFRARKALKENLLRHYKKEDL